MAQFYSMYDVDLKSRNNDARSLLQLIGEGDANGMRVGARVTDGGQPVALGGQCVGKVVRADGLTVPLAGTIDGNQAYVVLDQQSCAVEGQVQVAVAWVSGTNVTTLVIAYGTIVNTITGTIIQPSTPIPDLTQLLAEIENMRQATAAANAAAEKSVRYDTAQTLTDAQKNQARENIDAASEGDVDGLRSGITTGLTSTSLTGWESGSYISSGSNYNSDQRIRNQTKVGVSKGTQSISCDDGYKFLVLAYNASGTCLGILKTSGSFTTVDSGDVQWLQEFPCYQYPSYEFKVALSIDPDSASITVADGVHCYFNNTTDKTLSAENKAADAKKTGEIKAITDRLTVLSIDESQFVLGKYIASNGTAVANASYKISPFIRCAYKKIKFNCLTSGSGVLCMAFYSDASEATFISGYENTAALSSYPQHEMTVPDGTKYIRICKYTGSVYTATVAPWVKSTETGEAIAEWIDQAQGTADEALYKVEHIDPDEVLSNVYRVAFSDENLVTGYLPGYVDDSGAIKTSGDYKHSNYIDLTGNKDGKIYLNSGFVYWQYYAYYDEDKNYLGGKGVFPSASISNGIATYPIPSTAKYLIVSYSSTAQAEASWASFTGVKPTGVVINAAYGSYRDYKEYPGNPCDYDGAEISLFRNGICIGDSLTAGVCNYKQGGTEIINTTFPNYSYPTYLQKLTNVPVTNAGIGGLTTAQWYTNYLANHPDWSGYDFAIIQLGVNDALQNNGWTQEEETALTNIITKLKTDNQRIKIFVATILPATAYSGAAFDDISKHTRALVSGLGDADVILVDIAEYAHTAESLAYNAGHLTGLGYLRLAMDYKAYISMIIRDNPIDFRFVQFAGTDYSY